MLMIIQRRLLGFMEEIARGYAWVTLLPSWKAGIPLILLTFWNPATGLSGMLAAVCAWYAGQIAGATRDERPVCVFNGLLCGMFVAHVWIFGAAVIALTLLAGIFSGWLTVVLGRVVWSQVQLPVLSLPFALVAMLIYAAGASLGALALNPYVAPPDLFGNQIDAFLAAFGNLYFMADPFVGLFILLVILLLSRYYFLIAVLGYIAAKVWLKLLGAAPEDLAVSAWDSNAILAALVVGGLFATPAWLTAALAALAAVIAAWMALALERILSILHLLPFSLSFVIAAWIVLYAVLRNARMVNSFNLLRPDFPEQTYQRTQISRARIGEPGSVPLALPCTGAWTVSQGFSGQHTHRGPWSHALDFIVLKEGKSFSNKGNRLEDFYCYNQAVLSPAYGQVWRVVNDVPDNKPGTINVEANWGNFVLIRLYDGKFALLAHLKPWTIAVTPGVWLKPGDFIGYCGNSGRSPQPHIHMHLQNAEELGAATVPFHLASVLVSEADETPRYELSLVPQESSTLSAAVAGEVRPFYLLAGRGLSYTVTRNGSAPEVWTLRCEVDELGRFVLVSSAGGRCIAESTWAVFSCYERGGNKDTMLDVWLLACGYTPASFQIALWRDHSTPAAWLPQTMARLLSALAWPWTTFVDSSYHRHWDEEAQGWRQHVQHRQKISGMTLQAQALIVPQLGCTHIEAEMNSVRYTLDATSTFQRADIGVPAWEAALNISNQGGRRV